jgi:hypothetical protein
LILAQKRFDNEREMERFASGMQLKSIVSGFGQTSLTPTQETATQSAAPSTKVSIDAAIQQEESTNDSKGVARSELLEWWCELNKADLERKMDLERENKLFVKVVKRMVKSDRSLQELVCFEELPEVDGDVGSVDDPVLSVNPAFYAMD